MVALSFADAREMTTFGRIFARTESLVVIHEAACFIAAAKDDEKASLRINFEEGVRNNVDGDQTRLELIMRLLDAAVKQQMELAL